MLGIDEVLVHQVYHHRLSQRGVSEEHLKERLKRCSCSRMIWRGV
jgi:hypothetical protein